MLYKNDSLTATGSTVKEDEDIVFLYRSLVYKSIKKEKEKASRVFSDLEYPKYKKEERNQEKKERIKGDKKGEKQHRNVQTYIQICCK